MNLPYLLLVVAMVVLVQAAILSRQPFGLKMCQKLCSEVCGCSYPAFNASRLTCHVITSSDVTESSHNKCFQADDTQGEGKYKSELPMNCPRHSRKIHTRTTQLKCESKVRPQDINDVPARLLLYQYYSSRSVVIYQLFLNNNSLVKYQHLSLTKIEAMVFMPTTNELFLSTHGKGVISSRLDTSEIMVLWKNLHCDISFDAKLQVVFCLDDSKIYRLEPKTNAVTSTCKSDSDFLLSVDSIRKVIFTANTQRIRSGPYEGCDMQTIHRAIGINTFTSDPRENVLYYDDSTYIFKKNLISNITTRVANVPFYIRDMVVFGHRLYVTSKTGGVIGFLEKAKFTGLQQTGSRYPLQCAVVP